MIIMASEVNWIDTGATTTTTLAIPEFGGIMLSSDGIVFPWSGNDPDSNTQCFSYIRKVTELGPTLEPMI